MLDFSPTYFQFNNVIKTKFDLSNENLQFQEDIKNKKPLIF